MLPFETDIRFGEVTKNFITVMPRVVPDQRAKFDNDELFRKLSREGEIRYTGFRDRPSEERQLRFQTECREGHAEIVFVQSGMNLYLEFTTNSWSDRPEDRVPTQDYVDFDREPGKVYLKSQFILNGVCVVWKGWLDLHRLDGIGSVEFDEERANGYHRLLRSRVSMLEKSHPLFLLGLDRPKRGLAPTDTSTSHGEPDKKRTKKTETTVQIPIPVKPVVASSSLDRITGGFALAASASLHRPLLNISSHTVTSDILANQLAVSNAIVSRTPNIVTRGSLLANCPVKLYPWKPNMYIV